jgi:hypothetical protein
MRLTLKSLLPVSLLALSIGAAPLAAKPALRDVKEIDDPLMMILIANEIQETCDDISGHMIKGYAQLEGLKSKAAKMGYTRDEIDEYVTSKAEKARMRDKANAWLSTQGVNPSNKKSLCAFGEAQREAGGPIGSLLR